MSAVAQANLNMGRTDANTWPAVKLGEIAEFIMGQAPPGDASNFDGRGTIFVKAGEFGPLRPIVREWTTEPLRYANTGDVLICVVGATAGKLNLGIDCAIGRSVAAIRPNARTFGRFIYLQLLPKVLDLRAGSTGSAQGVINRKMLESIEVVLPPIAEQRRIVAEIEKQFTRLDAGIAALRRVQANLKRYRASVLKAACEGRLVPTEAELAKAEDRKYETGEELLARILAERRKNWQGRGKYKVPGAPATANLASLPEGWAWARLEQLGVTYGGLTKNPKRAKLPNQLPYLRVANVYANELRLDDIEQIGVAASELDKLLVRKGDLLIVEGNGSRNQIGRLAIWDGSIETCVHQNHLIKVRLQDESMSKWILYWLQSPNGRHFVELVASSTSGLYTLSVNKVGDLPIPLPPLNEQLRIVAEVERRLSIVEELEGVASSNLQRAVRLRRSILQRAFSKNGDAPITHGRP